jgi:hypothetical protein
MEFYLVTKKNEILSFTDKCMELEHIILSEVVMLRRPNITCYPSYADYRPKTNAVILWDIDHTKGRLYSRGTGQGKGTKNLNVVDILTLQK